MKLLILLAFVCSCSLTRSIGVSIDELETRLRAADQNRDGFLSIDEMAFLIGQLREREAERSQSAGQVAAAKQPAASVALARAPAVGSGVLLSIDRYLVQCRAADADGDGRLSPSERESVRQAWRAAVSASNGR